MIARKYLLACTAVAVLSVASLAGCGNKNTNTGNDNAVESNENTAAFADGTYTKAAEPDDKGYTYQIEMVVEGGKITAIDWNALDADGNNKKELSANGEYVMTEDGLTWGEQSEALSNYVIENQSLDGLTTDEEGRTDVVTGVSIKIGNFLSLLQDCMDQASAK